MSVKKKGARRYGDVRVIDESGEDYLYPADTLASATHSRVSGLFLRAR